MEIKLRGEMTIADIRQALFEKLHELETNYSVKFSRGAGEVLPRGRAGLHASFHRGRR